MADLTAKRTLVKSPPELWAELGELEALARHLGEFGEIRITRVEPEQTVAWEGEHACGTVELEASGWGTKVTLTAEVAEPEAAAPEPPEPEAAAPEPEPAAAASVPEPAASAPERPAPSEPEPVPPRWEPPRAPRPAAPARGGFLSRIFGRRPPAPSPDRPGVQRALEYPPRAEAGTTRPALQPSPQPTLQPSPQPAPEPVRHDAPAPDPDRKPEPHARPATAGAGAQREPAALDAQGALAVLEGVLDTLGSAHHRPFSRG